MGGNGREGTSGELCQGAQGVCERAQDEGQGTRTHRARMHWGGGGGGEVVCCLLVA